MKTSTLLSAIAISLALGSANADTESNELDRIGALIKAPESSDSRSAIMEQTDTLMNAARDGLDSAESVRSGNTIYLRHNRSILREAAYHLEQLVPYAGYQDALYLEKLQAMKHSRKRLARGEITEDGFQVQLARIDRDHSAEVNAASQFIERKTGRLQSLCAALEQNEQLIRDNLAAAGRERLNGAETHTLLALKNDSAWKAFKVGGDQGQKMRTALRHAERASPTAVTDCLENAFSFYEPNTGVPLLDAELVRALVGMYR